MSTTRTPVAELVPTVVQLMQNLPSAPQLMMPRLFAPLVVRPYYWDDLSAVTPIFLAHALKQKDDPLAPNSEPQLIAKIAGRPADGKLLELVKNSLTSTFLFCKEPVTYGSLKANLQQLYTAAVKSGRSSAAAFTAALAQAMFPKGAVWTTHTAFGWGDVGFFGDSLAALNGKGLTFDVPWISEKGTCALQSWVHAAVYGVPTKEFALHKTTDPFSQALKRMAACALGEHGKTIARVFDGRAQIFYRVALHEATLETLMNRGDLLVTFRFFPKQEVLDDTGAVTEVLGELYATALLRCTYSVLDPKAPVAMREDQAALESLSSELLMGDEMSAAATCFVPGSAPVSPELGGHYMLEGRSRVFAMLADWLDHPEQEDTWPIGSDVNNKPFVVNSKTNAAVLLSGPNQSGKTTELERLLFTHPELGQRSFTYLPMGDANTDDAILDLIADTRFCKGWVLDFPSSKYVRPVNTAEIDTQEQAVREFARTKFEGYLEDIRSGSKGLPFGMRKDKGTLATLAFTDEWLRLVTDRWAELLAFSGFSHHAVVADDYLGMYDLTRGEAATPYALAQRRIALSIISQIEQLPNMIRHRNGLVIVVAHQPDALGGELYKAFNLHIDIPQNDRGHSVAIIPSRDKLVLTKNLNLTLGRDVRATLQMH